MELSKNLEKFQIGVSDEDYNIIRNYSARNCHDAIIYLPKENKILLAIRKSEPAKGFLWPFGGGQKRGFPLKYSLAKVIKRETNLELSEIEQMGVPVDLFFNKGPNSNGVHDIANYFTAVGNGEINPDELHKTRLIGPEEYIKERESMAHWTRLGMDFAMERFFGRDIPSKEKFPSYYYETLPFFE